MVTVGGGGGGFPLAGSGPLQALLFLLICILIIWLVTRVFEF